MGAATFDSAQLDAMGAASLEEFAAWLRVSLAPVLPAAERIRVPLPWELRQALAGVTESNMFSELREESPGSCATATMPQATARSELAQSLALLAPSQQRSHAEGAASICFTF